MKKPEPTLTVRCNCGGAPMFRHHSDHNNLEYVTAECSDCKLKVPGDFASIDVAREAWTHYQKSNKEINGC